MLFLMDFFSEIFENPFFAQKLQCIVGLLTMASLSRYFLGFFLVVAYLSSPVCHGFTTSILSYTPKLCSSMSGPGRINCPPICDNNNGLRQQQRQQHMSRLHPLSMTTDDSSKEEETAKTEESVSSEVKSSTTDDTSEEETRGVAKTILMVPLFCKFVIVLLIKFITDLIVFPLLFLYRLVGIGKRRFLKLIGKGGGSGGGPEVNGKLNGET